MSKDFNINDYIDLSQITDPKRQKLFADTLQQMADLSGGKARELIKGGVETWGGEKIIITNNDDQNSIATKNTINISFNQISHINFLTDPQALKDYHDEDIYLNDQFKSENYSSNSFSLTGVLWHELGHVKHDKADLGFVVKAGWEVAKLNHSFDNFVESSSLPGDLKEEFLSMGMLELFETLKEPPQDLRTRIEQSTISHEDTDKLNDWIEKTERINSKLVEDHIIAEVNTDFRNHPDINLPNRYSHSSSHSDTPTELTDLKTLIQQNNIRDSIPISGGEEATHHDHGTSNIITTNPQTTPSTGRE